MFRYLILLFLVACGTPDGDGERVDGVPEGNHRIFVTSTTSQGDFGGIAAANSACQSAANNAGLVNNYKAILSDSGSDISDNLSGSGGVYVFNGVAPVLIAANINDLWNADFESLLGEVTYDENGNTVSSGVWTGTRATGDNGFANTCSDWTSSSSGANGLTGSTLSSDGSWIDDKLETCEKSLAIYCISQ
jgi:hypothetical protein